MLRSFCPCPEITGSGFFARSKDEEEDTFKEIMNYRLKSASRATRDWAYPLSYEAFQVNDGYVVSPLSGFLAPGEAQSFIIKVPDAKSVAVVQGDNWHRLERADEEDGLFEGDLLLEPGVAEVYARFAGSMTFDALLEYTVAEQP